MGWAKYFEDNVEITIDRYFLNRGGAQDIRINIFCSAKNVEKKRNNIAGIAKTYEKKYEKKTVYCKDCGKNMVLSPRYQQYLDNKSWHLPKRCNRCKSIKDMRSLMRPSF